MRDKETQDQVVWMDGNRTCIEVPPRMNKNSNSSAKPVSYTHLDVYKRQEYPQIKVVKPTAGKTVVL